jgi:multicomponent Na+:H+ antiporter subunit B
VKARHRILLFLPSALLLLALFVWADRDLVPFGHYRGPYGDVVNSITVFERHATNAVSAVNFDIRGLDTMGEETILFMSVLGVAMLLRRQKEESADNESRDESERRDVPQPSDAIKTVTMGLIGPLVVYGLYVVLHGQVTPGGGFQGGVILATAPLLAYLAEDLKTFKQITSHLLVEIGEAAGIAGYVGFGFLGLVLGGVFLRNVLPLGETGGVLSSGMIFGLNICSALAVAGGFVSVIYAFLEQTLEMRMGGKGE